MPDKRVKVLVVDDSPVARQLLVHILGSDPEIQVVGTAPNGAKALEALTHQRPDVVTMDLHMAQMDGLQATRRIMETQPVPIVIASANWSPEQAATTLRALQAGAVALVEKPRGVGHPDHAEMAKKLVDTVKAMSEVRVIRRWPRPPPVEASTAAPLPKEPGRTLAAIRLVAMGVSTGGPPGLQRILAGLPVDFPVPVLIVQHISPGFLQSMVEWLGQTTGRPIQIAAHGERPLAGHVYIAPDGVHMGVERGGCIALSQDPPESGLRPAVAYLFRSVARAFGARAVGVLLTGMGKDGAAELKLLRDKGAVTIAQDKESSVVHGMPGEAIRLKAATHILALDRIAPVLESLVSRNGPPCD